MAKDNPLFEEQQIVEFLQQVGGFSLAEEASLKEAASKAVITTYKAGALIIKQGELGNDLHVIVQGSVQVPLGTQSEQQNATVDLGPGNVIGEMGFLTNTPRTRNVVASDEVITLSWSRKELYFLLSGHPPLAQFLSDTLGRRLAESGIDRVGKYRIMDKLGEGSTSKVFHAYNPALKRAVAVKMLNHSLVFNKQFRGRFILEARTIAKLNHPNIVQIFDMESHYATYFMIMEFLDGHDLLKVLCDQGPMSVESTLSVLYQMAQGLSYSHAQGIVHGDIKPANCLITSSGTVKIMDFGVCRCVKMKIDESEKGLIFGTPQYTAPEVLTGQPIHMGSDIYALGVMAYQLLTGNSPFTRNSIEETARAHIYEELPRIETLRSDVTPELAEFIHRALEKKPNKRISNWDEVMALVKPPEHLLRARTCSHLLNLSYPESEKAVVESALDQLALSLRTIPDLTWQEGSFDSESRMKSREVASGDSPFGAPLSWLYDKIGTSLGDEKPAS